MYVFVGWVAKRLIKLYTDCCNDLSEPPNLLLLKKLYKLEVILDFYVIILYIAIWKVVKFELN